MRRSMIRRWLAPSLAAALVGALTLVVGVAAATAGVAQFTGQACTKVTLPHVKMAYVDIDAVGAAGIGTAHYAAPAPVQTGNASFLGAGVIYGRGGRGDEVKARLIGHHLSGRVLFVCVDEGGNGGGGGASGVSLGSNFSQPLVVAGGGGAGGSVISGGNKFAGTDATTTVPYPTLSISSCCDGGDVGRPGAFATGLGFPDVGGGGATDQVGGLAGPAGAQGTSSNCASGCVGNGVGFAEVGCSGDGFTSTGPGEGGNAPGFGCGDPVAAGPSGGGGGLDGGGAGGWFGFALPPAVDGYSDQAGGGGGSDYCGAQYLPSSTGLGISGCKTTPHAGTEHDPGHAADRAHVDLALAVAPTIRLTDPAPGEGYDEVNNEPFLGPGADQDQPVAGFSCAEPVSGIQSCTAKITVANGTNYCTANNPGGNTGKAGLGSIANNQTIGTYAPGAYQFTVIAKANSGLKTCYSRRYTVTQITRGSNPIKPKGK